jgi:hypothetical protein
MDTALEHIRAKIHELEGKLVDLKITERELLKLDKAPAQKPRKIIEPISEPELQGEADSTHSAVPKQSMSATIKDVLARHGALSVKGISEQIAASGAVITNRAISFALQAMKKRGLVKSANGEWKLAGRRSRQED